MTYNTIDTDSDVLDFVNNLAAIFEDNMERLRLAKIYKEDVSFVSATPSIALSCTGVMPIRRTIGRTQARYTYNYYGEVWYYSRTMTADVHRNLVMSEASLIMRHMMENATLNGWLRTREISIRGCNWMPRIRSGVLYASARIVLAAEFLTTVTSR